MKKFLLFGFSLFSIALHSQNAVLKLAGSSTIQPIVTKCGIMFEKRTGTKVNVKGGGSSFGAKSAINKSVQIGTVSRDLKDSEKKAGLKEYLIGLDGIAIIVNKRNPMVSISKEQVIEIYIGNKINWKDFNWVNEEISVVNKEEGRSTLELFVKYFELKGKIKEDVYMIGANFEEIAFVAGDKAAIGYVSIGSAEMAIQKGVDIKILELDNVLASIENVKNKTYPINRTLHVVTKGEAKGSAKRFISFLLSKEGQDVVEKENFIRID